MTNTLRSSVANQQPQELQPVHQVETSGHASEINLAQWIADNTTWVSDHLATDGALVLRGLNINTPQRLDALARHYPGDNFPYLQSLSNALRVNLTERVFTANEAPAYRSIDLHHEMAQTPFYPDVVMFACELAATSGGSTTVCDSVQLYQLLKQQMPDFINQCHQLGVRYRQRFAYYADTESAQGRGWPHLLNLPTTLRKTPSSAHLYQLKPLAEQKLNQLNYDFCWHPDQSLEITTPVLPAVKQPKHSTQKTELAFF